MKPTHYTLLICFAFWTLQSCSVKRLPLEQRFHQKKVLFLGNSITQNGMYVSCIQYGLQQAYPAAAIDIVSIGLSSETVSCLTEPVHPYPRPCLEERIDRALEATQPDIILACYGMNDGIYHPLSPEIMEAYQKGIRDLIAKAESKGAELILITPPPFDAVPIKSKTVGKEAPQFGYATPYEGYDEVLGAFSEWLLSLDSKKLQVIDLHTAFNRELQRRRRDDPDFTFAGDGVHPSPEGHLVMARVILEGLGAPLNKALPLNWSDLEKDTRFQRVHTQRQTRSSAMLPYVGYTRGQTVKSFAPKPVLVLLGGQSNMVGLGRTNQLKGQKMPDNITFLDYYSHARLRNKPQQFGPEIGLASTLHELAPDQPFILFKYAVGGSSLLDWAPDYSEEKARITKNTRFGNLYRQWTNTLDSLITLYDPEMTALLWLQGGRDGQFPAAANAYADNFKAFIAAIRQHTARADFPIIFGQIDFPSDRFPGIATVQEAQAQVAQEVPGVYMIDISGLPRRKDNVHYNTQGQLELGRRFGVKLVELLRQQYQIEKP